MIRAIDLGEHGAALRQPLEAIARCGFDTVAWPNGYTALHYAAEKVNDMKIVEIFCHLAPNMGVRDEEGLRPVDYAELARRDHVVGIIQLAEREREGLAADRQQVAHRKMPIVGGPEDMMSKVLTNRVCVESVEVLEQNAVELRGYLHKYPLSRNAFSRMQKRYFAVVLNREPAQGVPTPCFELGYWETLKDFQEGRPSKNQFPMTNITEVICSGQSNGQLLIRYRDGKKRELSQIKQIVVIAKDQRGQADAAEALRWHTKLSSFIADLPMYQKREGPTNSLQHADSKANALAASAMAALREVTSRFVGGRHHHSVFANTDEDLIDFRNLFGETDLVEVAKLHRTNMKAPRGAQVRMFNYGSTENPRKLLQVDYLDEVEEKLSFRSHSSAPSAIDSDDPDLNTLCSDRRNESDGESGPKEDVGYSSDPCAGRVHFRFTCEGASSVASMKRYTDEWLYDDADWGATSGHVADGNTSLDAADAATSASKHNLALREPDGEESPPPSPKGGDATPREWCKFMSATPSNTETDGTKEAGAHAATTTHDAESIRQKAEAGESASGKQDCDVAGRTISEGKSDRSGFPSPSPLPSPSPTTGKGAKASPKGPPPPTPQPSAETTMSSTLTKGKGAKAPPKGTGVAPPRKGEHAPLGKGQPGEGGAVGKGAKGPKGLPQGPAKGKGNDTARKDLAQEEEACRSPLIKPNRPMRALWWTKFAFGKQLVGGGSVWDSVQDLTGEIPVAVFEERFGKPCLGEARSVRCSAGDLQEDPKDASTKLIRIFMDPNIIVGKERALRKLPKPEDVRMALEELDSDILGPESLQVVKDHACPTFDQAKLLDSMRQEDPTASFAPPEEYMWHVSRVPFFLTRISCWSFTYSFEERLSTFRALLSEFEKVQEAIHTSKGLVWLFGLILAAGNYLNGDTARGRADGFDLDSLAKLETVRDNLTGSQDLRHFIIEMLLLGGPVSVKLGAAEEQEAHAKASRMLEELAPVFRVVSRVVMTDAGGGIKVQKSVRVVLEEVDEGVSELAREFKMQYENLQVCAQHCIDPADPMKLHMMTQFSDARSSLKELEVQLGSCREGHSRLMKYFNHAGMRSNEFIMFFDNLFVPPTLIANVPDAFRKNHLVPRLCKPRIALTVEDLLVLWGLCKPEDLTKTSKPRMARQSKKGDQHHTMMRELMVKLAGVRERTGS